MVSPALFGEATAHAFEMAPVSDASLPGNTGMAAIRIACGQRTVFLGHNCVSMHADTAALESQGEQLSCIHSQEKRTHLGEADGDGARRRDGAQLAAHAVRELVRHAEHQHVGARHRVLLDQFSLLERAEEVHALAWRSATRHADGGAGVKRGEDQGHSQS